MPQTTPTEAGCASTQLVNPTLASVAVAACVGVPGREIALIAEVTTETLAQMPPTARTGFAVDAASGEIFAPGAVLPVARPLFASIRIPLPHDVPGPDAVLDMLATLAGNGWRLQRAPVLVPALNRSVHVIRATPDDLSSPNLPSPSLPSPNLAEPGRAGPSLARRQGADGSGVLIGVVDFGCDFAHPAFLGADGRTRLLFLWDQNDGDAGGVPGSVREQAEIDAAIRADDPYAALGYWPDRNCYAPAACGQDELVHGTHVLGVAAGRGADGIPPGVAPGATLAFVHLRPGALVTAGDPADVFDGVCAIFSRADALRMPAVVNLSLGANLGSHDGNTLYDRALDATLARPGRAITVAAGNERQSRLNVDGDVVAGTPVRLRWQFSAGDRTENTVRIFCETTDRSRAVTCSVSQNGIELGQPIRDGCNASRLFQGGQVGAGQERGMVYSGLAPTPGPDPLQHIEIRFQPSGLEEQVDLVLSTSSAQPLRFDAWIDRDDRQAASQSHFALPEPLTRSTVVGTACGHRTLCVGAFDHRNPDYLAAVFSAEGLTRDARRKPDLCAPGIEILAASAYGGRTLPQSVWRKALTIRMSGTSAAAPHVAGIFALLFQAAPSLSAEDGATILRETSRLDPSYAGADWHPQCGSGRVDAAAALGRLRRGSPRS